MKPKRSPDTISRVRTQVGQLGLTDNSRGSLSMMIVDRDVCYLPQTAKRRELTMLNSPE